MKVGNIVGLTRTGNGISKRMQQARNALTTNVILAGSMGVNMISSVASKDFASFSASAGVGYLATKEIINLDKTITKLMPEYKKIVKRAESIYKKEIV